MARQQSLAKLYDRLRRQHAQIARTFSGELGELRHNRGEDGGSDEGDRASQSLSMDVASRLAEMDSDELRRIQRAMLRYQEGLYGQCELCGKNIPLARLEALPHTGVCVGCQEKIESDPRVADQMAARWDRVDDGIDTGSVFDFSQIER